MGSSKKQTVGYWYRPVFQMVLGRGPVDAILRIRGADVDAWSGELTDSGTITINRPGLWGGASSEGGIVGDLEVSMGDAAQAPNAYAAAQLGADGSAHRGQLSMLWRGGRFGAMNPYPKPVSVLVRRILEGWELAGGACWYEGTAEVPLAGVDAGPPDMSALGEPIVFSAIGALQQWTAPAGAVYAYIKAWGAGGEAGQVVGAAGSGGPGGGGGFVEGFVPVVAGAVYDVIVGGRGLGAVAGFGGGGDGATSGSMSIYRRSGGGGGRSALRRGGIDLIAGPGGGGGGASDSGGSGGGGGGDEGSAGVGEAPGAGATQFGGGVGGVPSGSFAQAGEEGSLEQGGSGRPASGSVDDANCAGGGGGGGYYGGGGGGGSNLDGGGGGGGSALVPSAGATETGVGTVPGGVADADYIGYGVGAAAPGGATDGGLIIRVQATGLVAINPAHVLYYSLVSETMQGEPEAYVNEASFTAAADLFFDEGLGICTEWDQDKEDLEQFRSRICEAVGARMSRSTVDGQWYLDVMRGQYTLESLPVLTDDDVLDFEGEPAVLDDAVNQVAVQWFDPLTKQERTTAPLQALGAIDAGGVNAQTLSYTCLPTESLALRAAARELRARATPLWRYKLVTNRRPYAWRTGTYFRLQAPKRGVADMVCLVGDIEKGTLRSGAISLTVVQDVFSMPATTYVEAQVPIEPPGSTPAPVTEQLAFEAPYLELVQRMGAADLAALAADAGYLATVGAQPGAGINYELHTRPSAGEYESAGEFDWCPTATVVEASAAGETAFTLAGTSLLDRVELGTAALWGDEIVRVDALDAEAGTVTLARGCADTVPRAHGAGERIWFHDAWAGGDGVEYVDGETAEAKLLTRTGTQLLALAAAPVASLTFDARAARPYPPGNVLVNGSSWPSIVSSSVSVAWAHRDRVLQADQLVDTTEADIGPEAGTTYNVFAYDDAGGALLDSASGLTGATWSPSIAGVYRLRIELEAERGGITSWQRQIRVFDFVGDSGRATEDSGNRITEADEVRATE